MDQNTTIPQSGSLTAFLATGGFWSRVFRSLGSKPVLLSWNVSTKEVSITPVSPEGILGEAILNVTVKQIERVYIINGNYVLQVNGQTYDMEIQHYKGQKSIVHDLLGAEIGGVASAYVDAKSDGEKFIRFLQQELPPQLMAVSIFRSTARIKATIFVAITFIALLVGIGVYAAMQK
jgi:hypothetical protein